MLVDSLSRSPDYELAYVTNLSSSVTELICAAYAKNEQYVALIRALGGNEFNNLNINLSALLHARLHMIFIDQGLLYYSMVVEETPRVVVAHDEEMKYRIRYEAMILG